MIKNLTCTSTSLVIRALVFFAFSLINMAPQAAPVLLWDNGDPNYANGWNLGNSIEDDFSFSSNETLGLIDTYIYNSQDINFAEDLFVKIDGSDIDILSSSILLSGYLPSTGLATVYKVSLDIVDTFLLAGTYTLEVGSLTNNSNHAWIWTDTLQLQPSTVNGDVRPEYPPTDAAFQLYAPSNNVPEPSILFMFVLGLIGLRVPSRQL